MLRRLRDSVAAKREELLEAVIEEYGAPASRAAFMVDHPVATFDEAIGVLEGYSFRRTVGRSEVVMTPLGVAGLITPWNSNAGFICSKLAMALAAGCTSVIKPSEMSAMQTAIVSEAIHAADLPPGIVNVVTGRGDIVGAEISRHPDVAKISFTGSTAVGKAILKAGSDTLKRVTLELGGKSPTILLDDAELTSAISMAVQAAFMNSGQACIAGTRLLAPRSRLAEIEALAGATVAAVRVGDPRKPEVVVGPMVSKRQWERVQHYIRLGIEEGARLLVGGMGRPDGLDGWFVRPTLFAGVTNDMTIAREEIFGPVLSVIAYDDEEEAVRIANDTDYGLQAYVLSGNEERAERVAEQLEAGRVLVNTLAHDPKVPFGGFKQSGLGREYGTFGLEAYLEPKALLGKRIRAINSAVGPS